MMRTTASSFACGLDRAAITSWRLTRISRAEAAAVTAIALRYQIDNRGAIAAVVDFVPSEPRWHDRSRGGNRAHRVRRRRLGELILRAPERRFERRQFGLRKRHQPGRLNRA